MPSNVPATIRVPALRVAQHEVLHFLCSLVFHVHPPTAARLFAASLFAILDVQHDPFLASHMSRLFMHPSWVQSSAFHTQYIQEVIKRCGVHYAPARNHLFMRHGALALPLERNAEGEIRLELVVDATRSALRVRRTIGDLEDLAYLIIPVTEDTLSGYMCSDITFTQVISRAQGWVVLEHPNVDWVLQFLYTPTSFPKSLARGRDAERWYQGTATFAEVMRKVVDYHLMLDNLSTTQDRCSELLNENRRLRAEARKKDA